MRRRVLNSDALFQNGVLNLQSQENSININDTTRDKTKDTTHRSYVRPRTGTSHSCYRNSNQTQELNAVTSASCESHSPQKRLKRRNSQLSTQLTNYTALDTNYLSNEKGSQVRNAKSIRKQQEQKKGNRATEIVNNKYMGKRIAKIGTIAGSTNSRNQGKDYKSLQNAYNIEFPTLQERQAIGSQFYHHQGLPTQTGRFTKTGILNDYNQNKGLTQGFQESFIQPLFEYPKTSIDDIKTASLANFAQPPSKQAGQRKIRSSDGKRNRRERVANMANQQIEQYRIREYSSIGSQPDYRSSQDHGRRAGNQNQSTISQDISMDQANNQSYGMEQAIVDIQTLLSRKMNHKINKNQLETALIEMFEKQDSRELQPVQQNLNLPLQEPELLSKRQPSFNQSEVQQESTREIGEDPLFFYDSSEPNKGSKSSARSRRNIDLSPTGKLKSFAHRQSNTGNKKKKFISNQRGSIKDTPSQPIGGNRAVSSYSKSPQKSQLRSRQIASIQAETKEGTTIGIGSRMQQSMTTSNFSNSIVSQQPIMGIQSNSYNKRKQSRPLTGTRKIIGRSQSKEYSRKNSMQTVAENALIQMIQDQNRECIYMNYATIDLQRIKPPTERITDVLLRHDQEEGVHKFQQTLPRSFMNSRKASELPNLEDVVDELPPISMQQNLSMSKQDSEPAGMLKQLTNSVPKRRKSSNRNAIIAKKGLFDISEIQQEQERELILTEKYLNSTLYDDFLSRQIKSPPRVKYDPSMISSYSNLIEGKSDLTELIQPKKSSVIQKFKTFVDKSNLSFDQSETSVVPTFFEEPSKSDIENIISQTSVDNLLHELKYLHIDSTSEIFLKQTTIREIESSMIPKISKMPLHRAITNLNKSAKKLLDELVLDVRDSYQQQNLVIIPLEVMNKKFQLVRPVTNLQEICIYLSKLNIKPRIKETKKLEQSDVIAQQEFQNQVDSANKFNLKTLSLYKEINIQEFKFLIEIIKNKYQYLNILRKHQDSRIMDLVREVEYQQCMDNNHFQIKKEFDLDYIEDIFEQTLLGTVIINQKRQSILKKFDKRNKSQQMADIIFFDESQNVQYNLFDKDDMFELEENFETIYNRALGRINDKDYYSSDYSEQQPNSAVQLQYRGAMRDTGILKHTNKPGLERKQNIGKIKRKKPKSVKIENFDVEETVQQIPGQISLDVTTLTKEASLDSYFGTRCNLPLISKRFYYRATIARRNDSFYEVYSPYLIVRPDDHFPPVQSFSQIQIQDNKPKEKPQIDKRPSIVYEENFDKDTTDYNKIDFDYVVNLKKAKNEFELKRMKNFYKDDPRHHLMCRFIDMKIEKPKIKDDFYIKEKSSLSSNSDFSDDNNLNKQVFKMLRRNVQPNTNEIEQGYQVIEKDDYIREFKDFDEYDFEEELDLGTPFQKAQTQFFEDIPDKPKPKVNSRKFARLATKEYMPDPHPVKNEKITFLAYNIEMTPKMVLEYVEAECQNKQVIRELREEKKKIENKSIFANYNRNEEIHKSIARMREVVDNKRRIQAKEDSFIDEKMKIKFLKSIEHGILYEIPDLILRFNKNLDKIHDDQGSTPLSIAAQCNHFTILTMLIEAGADVNTVDNKKNTPLHYAQQFGFKRVSELLIEKGANESLKNEDGLTAWEGLKRDK